MRIVNTLVIDKKTGKAIWAQTEAEDAPIVEITLEELEQIRIDTINNKAKAIIYGKYPQEKQSSAQLGIYGDEYLAAMKAFIKQVIDISNKAIDDKIPADEVNLEELDK